MGYLLYNPHENKVSVARHAELFKNILKYTRSKWKSHFTKESGSIVGLREDYGFVATLDREIRHDSERDVGYGITDSWDEIVETLQGEPVSTNTELGRHMTAFETRVRQDTNEIYTRLDDEQSGRQLLAGRLNMLFRDRRAHARIARLMDTEAITDAGGRSQEAEAAHRGTKADKEASDLDDRLQAMIDQGVTAALAARDANRSTEGVASLSQWFERMEFVFHIRNCIVENQVKFHTCTLHSVALAWCNTHVKTVGHDAAYGMPWKTLMKMMTDKYCPRNEIKKLEMEI
ncbi:hypothetical protein Tco_0891095 [Tanacetum coccineum]|uniref:Uncharacterized protein n=1 Tax=Tanacetum coccineum TaxID=301880 RepID=A0ABQ5C3H0_9ASTR